MVGLLDIGPLKRSVTIRDQELAVTGLSARGLFDLLDQFPELRKLMSNAGIAISAEELMKHAPGAVETACVYVLGYRRCASANTEYNQACEIVASLTIGEQTEILKAAWELTFPKGLQSFLEALEGIGAIGSGKDQAMASPGQSSNSSPPVTQ